MGRPPHRRLRRVGIPAKADHYRPLAHVVEVEMATKVTVALEYDLDGCPAVATVWFAVGGAEHEIDLNKNAAVFANN